jgi:hypothetical protein
MVRFIRRERIGEKGLLEAITRADRGIVDADLGGGLIKQRVARPGQGRSAGYRTIIAYRAGARAVFVYGPAKNERANIDDSELLSLRKIGGNWLNADATAIAQAINEGDLTEIGYGDEET